MSRRRRSRRCGSPRLDDEDRFAGDDRGQLVLVAAAVLALALVPVAFAYLQLGYHGDVRAQSADRDAGAETVRLLERAVHEAVVQTTGQPWAGREGVANRANASLEDDVATVEAARLERGVASRISQNGSSASAWAGDSCPGGVDRDFGPCETRGGLVLQERADEAHLVAVAFDVHLVEPAGEVDLTVVVRAVGGRVGE